MPPPEGDLRPEQGKEISMPEMALGMKTGFWFRGLKSKRGEETVQVGRQPVWGCQSQSGLGGILVRMVALHKVLEPKQAKKIFL